MDHGGSEMVDEFLLTHKKDDKRLPDDKSKSVDIATPYIIPPVTSFEQSEILSAASSVTQTSFSSKRNAAPYVLRKNLSIISIATQLARNEKNDGPDTDAKDKGVFKHEEKIATLTEDQSDASTAASSSLSHGPEAEEESFHEERDNDAVSVADDKSTTSKKSIKNKLKKKLGMRASNGASGVKDNDVKSTSMNFVNDDLLTDELKLTELVSKKREDKAKEKQMKEKRKKAEKESRTAEGYDVSESSSLSTNSTVKTRNNTPATANANATVPSHATQPHCESIKEEDPVEAWAPRRQMEGVVANGDFQATSSIACGDNPLTVIQESLSDLSDVVSGVENGIKSSMKKFFGVLPTLSSTNDGVEMILPQVSSYEQDLKWAPSSHIN